MQKTDLKNELPDEVQCPLYNKIISSGTCCDLALVVDNLAPRVMTDFDIENTPNCKEICKKCKWHDV